MLLFTVAMALHDCRVEAQLVKLSSRTLSRFQPALSADQILVWKYACLKVNLCRNVTTQCFLQTEFLGTNFDSG